MHDFELRIFNTDLHEYLEFYEPINSDETASVIKNYFLGHIRRAALAENTCGSRYRLELNLTVNGREPYTMKDIPAMVQALLNLSKGDIIKVDCNSVGMSSVMEFSREEQKAIKKGESVKVYGDDINWDGTGLLNYMTSIAHTADFLYKSIGFDYDSGMIFFDKIDRGEIVDILDGMTRIKPDADYSRYSWWSNSASFAVDLYNEDERTAADIYERLHKAVRELIPEDEIQYCEELWNDGEPEVIINIQWITDNIYDIENFFERVNGILLPRNMRSVLSAEEFAWGEVWCDRHDGDGGNIWCDAEHFAIAALGIFEDGIHVMMTEF